jgi:hypothetical protein
MSETPVPQDPSDLTEQIDSAIEALVARFNVEPALSKRIQITLGVAQEFVKDVIPEEHHSQELVILLQAFIFEINLPRLVDGELVDIFTPGDSTAWRKEATHQFVRFAERLIVLTKL